MRDLLALWLIRLARKFTTWGPTYDHLVLAEKQQEFWTEERNNT